MKVETTKGTLVRNTQTGASTAPLTEEQAEALAVECNARAEKLGIEARYEVKP